MSCAWSEDMKGGGGGGGGVWYTCTQTQAPMETLASLYKCVGALRKHTAVKSVRLFCEATLLQCSGPPPGGAEQQLTTAAALRSSGWSGPGLLVLLEFTLAPF